MKQFYKSTERLVLCLGLIFSSFNAIAQPTVLRTEAASAGTWTNYAVSDMGTFRQARFQASTAGAAGRGWLFGEGSTTSATFTTNWRPWSGSGTQVRIPGYNQIITPSTSSPPTYGSATYNTGSGGVDGQMQAIVANRYYNFNLSKNSSSGSPQNETMAVLETDYNPVAISTVTRSATTIYPNNAALIQVTTASAPANGEFLYLRYTTNNWTSSTIVPVAMQGTRGEAVIPCFTNLTKVDYYVYSSNRTKAQIDAAVTSNGQLAHDLFSLNLNNNAGSNYTYTVTSGTAFIGAYLVPSTCYSTINSFVTALNSGTVSGPVTLLVSAGHTETAPVGGIQLTKSGTSTDKIVIRRTGVGINPTIRANAGVWSTAQNTTGTCDAIFRINGADYITIDGIK